MSGHAWRVTDRDRSSGAAVDVSLVVPVYNERPTLGALFDQCGRRSAAGIGGS
jgi:hypothetical protein